MICLTQNSSVFQFRPKSRKMFPTDMYPVGVRVKWKHGNAILFCQLFILLCRTLKQNIIYPVICSELDDAQFIIEAAISTLVKVERVKVPANFLRFETYSQFEFIITSPLLSLPRREHGQIMALHNNQHCFLPRRNTFRAPCENLDSTRVLSPVIVRMH